MPRKKLKLPMVEVEFTCFNCDSTFAVKRQPKLFCSDGCQQEAAFVRYFRKCKSSDKLRRPDIEMAFRIRRGHILNGGYKLSVRRIPVAIRKEVLERDKETCQKCGSPSREIDHIDGSSHDPKNLQVLCRYCHDKKTISNMKRLTPEVDGFEDKQLTIDRLRQRSESIKPIRLCDDEIHWNSNQKVIMADLRQAIRNERLVALGENEGFQVSGMKDALAKSKILWIEKIAT